MRKGANIGQLKSDITLLTNRYTDVVNRSIERQDYQKLSRSGLEHQLVLLTTESDKLRLKRNLYMGTQLEVTYSVLMKRLTMAIGEINNCIRTNCGRSYNIAELLNYAERFLRLQIVQPSKRENLVKQWYRKKTTTR